MKTFLYFMATMAAPGVAMAHGGHPEVVDQHVLMHALYFGVPIVFVGLATALIMNKTQGKDCR